MAFVAVLFHAVALLVRFGPEPHQRSWEQFLQPDSCSTSTVLGTTKGGEPSAGAAVLFSGAASTGPGPFPFPAGATAPTGASTNMNWEEVDANDPQEPLRSKSAASHTATSGSSPSVTSSAGAADVAVVPPLAAGEGHVGPGTKTSKDFVPDYYPTKSAAPAGPLMLADKQVQRHQRSPSATSINDGRGPGHQGSSTLPLVAHDLSPASSPGGGQGVVGTSLHGTRTSTATMLPQSPGTSSDSDVVVVDSGTSSSTAPSEQIEEVQKSSTCVYSLHGFGGDAILLCAILQYCVIGFLARARSRALLLQGLDGDQHDGFRYQGEVGGNYAADPFAPQIFHQEVEMASGTNPVVFNTDNMGTGTGTASPSLPSGNINSSASDGAMPPFRSTTFLPFSGAGHRLGIEKENEGSA